MKTLARFCQTHPAEYFSLTLILTAAVVTLYFILLRRNRKKIAALLNVFDPGTGTIGKDEHSDYVFGLFHGRPASVEAKRAIVSRVDISVFGRFYMPFQAETPRGKWIDKAQSLMKILWGWFYFFEAFFINFYIMIGRPGGSIWKAIGIFVSLSILIALAVYTYGKLAGYFVEAPISMCPVDLPGLGVWPFLTYLPDRFGTAIQHPEIRESFAHLLVSCRADMIEMPGKMHMPAKDQKAKTWISPIGATWICRDRFLNKEKVHHSMMELSTLCSATEEAFPETTRF